MLRCFGRSWYTDAAKLYQGFAGPNAFSPVVQSQPNCYTGGISFMFERAPPKEENTLVDGDCTLPSYFDDT